MEPVSPRPGQDSQEGAGDLVKGLEVKPFAYEPAALRIKRAVERFFRIFLAHLVSELWTGLCENVEIGQI